MSEQHLMGLVPTAKRVPPWVVFMYSYCSCGWVGQGMSHPREAAEAWRDHMNESGDTDGN